MTQSTEATTDARMIAIERLNWVRNFTHTIVEEMQGDQLVARAGGAGNHALWVLGHLACTDDFFQSALTGNAPSVPESTQQMFGGGSKPIDDLSAYPTKDELLDLMAKSRQALINWIDGLGDDQGKWNQPLPDNLQGFAPNAITLPFGIAAHEWFHTGQIATVRASLGLPPVNF